MVCRLTRYDTVDLRALKSWRDGQLNLAHGPETKNKEKNEIKNPTSSEETVQAKVREDTWVVMLQAR